MPRWKSTGVLTLHLSRILTQELLDRFHARNATNGHTPTAAIARLMRRYVEQGFDDGQPEQYQPPPQPPRPTASDVE